MIFKDDIFHNPNIYLTAQNPKIRNFAKQIINLRLKLKKIEKFFKLAIIGSIISLSFLLFFLLGNHENQVSILPIGSIIVYFIFLVFLVYLHMRGDLLRERLSILYLTSCIYFLIEESNL